MKAQLKIQEMAFMLVAVVLFFGLAGLFAMMMMYSSLQKASVDIKETRTLTAVTSLSDSPELSCTLSKSNCIDADKLISLTGKTSYKNFWPFSSLKIVKMSAFNKDEKNMIPCTKANYPDCELFVVYDKNVENERALSSFVALCRKEYENGYTYDLCEVAKVVAGTTLTPPSGKTTEITKEKLNYDTTPYVDKPKNTSKINTDPLQSDKFEYTYNLRPEKICETVNQSELKALCYKTINSSTQKTVGGLTICDFISDPAAKKKCQEDIRADDGSQRDISMCNEIQDAQAKSLCYKYINGDTK